jgi:ribosomal protein S18 acetylase RimI-like enzyme
MITGREETSLTDSPHVTIRVESCGPADYERLLSMYDAFFPEAITQGIPPSENEARRRWVEMLLDIGQNFLAVEEDAVIGHAALLPDTERQDGEYIIFVVRAHRKEGVGSELTRTTLEKARSMGLSNVWLTVESDNFKAIRLYKKFGFTFRDKGMGERTMMIEL